MVVLGFLPVLIIAGGHIIKVRQGALQLWVGIQPLAMRCPLVAVDILCQKLLSAYAEHPRPHAVPFVSSAICRFRRQALLRVGTVRPLSQPALGGCCGGRLATLAGCRWRLGGWSLPALGLHDLRSRAALGEGCGKRPGSCVAVLGGSTRRVGEGGSFRRSRRRDASAAGRRHGHGGRQQEQCGHMAACGDLRVAWLLRLAMVALARKVGGYRCGRNLLQRDLHPAVLLADRCRKFL
mmetsp:Transcript_30512/g.76333  ORF Transcript_30512/g.76333 Transcript_30512/m.76333 type:complete len:237 (+) Transcript_30512:368-1078(+)